ncbi:insulinase family protein [Shewanella colwelliana]|uniref:insulinase family protein n=1 Tax=Shewanella colwelliana TaxID=23 RepID=UPI0022AEC77B|nr:insulinase family protein [Shewanella colwelliana]MCZ4337707.1 insulinase family protein [Shewanella colwelliana]
MKLHHLINSLVLFSSVTLGFTPSAFAIPKGTTGSQIETMPQDSFILDNGLKVLLLQNTGAQISGASISVAGGQMSSPATLQGLPHLLEHIIFLGSEKYPNPNDWHQFVSKHSGWSNGSTQSDLTRFQFQVESQGVKEGLARLSAMLFTPNINEETVKIGLSEVDKEFASKKNNEWQGILSVIRANVNPEHPGSKFGIGNADSLAATPIELISALKQYQEEFYIPENMTLAVYTNEDLTAMRSYIEKTFKRDFSLFDRASLTLSSWMKPDVKSPSELPLFNNESQAALISVETNSQNHTLDLRFELPAATDAKTYAIYQLVADLLGHEGEGSILSTLKQYNLATSLNTVFQGDGQNEVLDIYIELTEHGVSSYFTLIMIVFDYIDLLLTEEMPAYVQTEKAKLLQFKKSASGRQDVADWLGELSNDMLRMPSANWTTYKLTPRDVTQQSIVTAIRPWLSPERMQMILTSPSVKGLNETPYFGTKYSVSKFEEKVVESWKNIKEQHVVRKISYPQPNPYIKNWDTKSVYINRVQYGKRVNKIKTVDFPDSLDATVVVNISTDELSLSEKTAKAYNLAQKLVLMSRFETALGKDQYFAEQAGYRVRAEQTVGGIRLTFSGRREGISMFIANVMNNALKVCTDQAEYDRLSIHAAHKLNTYLNKNNFNAVSYDTELTAIGYKQTSDKVISYLEGFVDDLDNKAIFDTYVAGQAAKEGVFDIYYAGDVAFLKNNHLFSQFGYDIVSAPKYWSNGSQTFKFLSSQTVKQGLINLSWNDATSMRFTGSIGADEYARLLIHRELWETKFKNYMRQEKQIAYHAGVRLSKMVLRPSIDFIIETNEKNSEAPSSAFDQFFKDGFENLTDDEIEAAKRQALQRFNAAVRTQQGALDMMQREMHATQQLEFIGVKALFTKAIMNAEITPLM